MIRVNYHSIFVEVDSDVFAEVPIALFHESEIVNFVVVLNFAPRSLKKTRFCTEVVKNT